MARVTGVKKSGRPASKAASKAKAARKGAAAIVLPESAPAETIDPASLLAVDILLYRGRGWLSKAIQFFDGTDVSHSSLFLAGTPASVAEAISKGLLERPLTDSVGDSAWVVARRLKTRPADVAPVLARANSYLSQGERYGYEQILLLAFLSLIRKPKITPIFKRLVTAVLEKASALLLKLTAGGKQPMICSELVYRSYDEALPDALDLFSLSVQREVTTEALQRPAKRVQVDRVHPESVLAAVVQRRQPRRRATAQPESAAPSNLTPLIQRYLREVKEPSVEAMSMASASDVADAEVVAAVSRFAANWRGATSPETKTVSSESAGVDAALADLYRTAADFVTPGDLLKSESLMTLGRLSI
jgi:hypothetical protein